MIRGRFITLEGGEGAGKSTQALNLKARLQDLKIPVLLTREPGGSPKAEILRDLLLEGMVKPFGPQAEALFFAVARRDHVQATIAPALETGTWVICDRFMDSTRAYQGAEGVSDETLSRLETLAVGKTLPDLTFIFDLPVDMIPDRLKNRGTAADRFENVDTGILETRRQLFLALVDSQPDRCVLIDATASQDTVRDRIFSEMSERLGIGETPPASGA